jgi:hypothetical protein
MGLHNPGSTSVGTSVTGEGSRPPVARVAETGGVGVGVAWNTANDAVLAEGRRVLIDDETRLDGVAVVGVDERVAAHPLR